LLVVDRREELVNCHTPSAAELMVDDRAPMRDSMRSRTEKIKQAWHQMVATLGHSNRIGCTPHSPS
jgi:hypothetical protein